MSQIYNIIYLQKQLMLSYNNNYYQLNYYIEDDYLSNISYPSYYEQQNIYGHPKNYG